MIQKNDAFQSSLRWGIFAVILFSIGVFGTEITKIDVRFALMTEDLFRHGLNLFPTINGVEYCDYPSAWILLSAGGAWNHELFRRLLLDLPTILAGAYTVGMTYYVGERFNIGKSAAVLLLLTPEFIHLATGVGLDMPIAAVGITLLFLFTRPDPARGCLYWFPALLAVSFAVRGPMGIVITGSMTAGYWLMKRNWRIFFRLGVSGLAASAVIAFLWYKFVLYQGGNELWNEFLHCQIGSRFGKGSYFEYFISGFFSFAPVTMLSVMTLRDWKSAFFQRHLLPLWGAVVLPVVILSIPGCKHLRYLGLTLPFMALLAAVSIARAVRTGFYQSRIAPFHKYIFPAAVILSGCGLAGILAAGCILPAPYHVPWGHAAAAAGLIAGVVVFRKKRDFCWLPLIVFFCWCVIPFEAALENSADFVRDVETHAKGKILLCNLGPDHDDLKFLLSASPSARSRTEYLYANQRGFSAWVSRMYPSRTMAETKEEWDENDLFIFRDNDPAYFQKEFFPPGKTFSPVCRGRMGHRGFITGRLENSGKTQNGVK